MTDIKESKEAIAAVAALVKEVMVLSKDGYDFGDAISFGTKFLGDEKFRQTLIEGVKGADQILAEMKDLEAKEVGELLAAVVAELKA